MSAQEAKAALQGLAEAAAPPLDRNDLGRLARIHSLCQALAVAEGPPIEAARQAIHRLSAGLVVLLEKLILDEAARPKEGLALVGEAVSLIRQGFSSQAIAVDEIMARLEACITGADLATPDYPVGEPYVSEPLVIDLDETEHLAGFIEESREHMNTIEVALLEVEQNPSDTGKINELFRPFHTIKGIAGFLNLRDINRLTHEVETILDMGRQGELPLTSSAVDRIFAAVDLLKIQIAEISNFLAHPQGNVCPQPDIVTMMAELRAIQAAQFPVTKKKPAEPRPKLGEVLVCNEAATAREVEQALDAQAREPPPPRKVGEILVDQGAVSDKQVDSALVQQATGTVVAAEQSIRVDTVKLDALVDAVGELVIAQTMVNLNDAVDSDARLRRDVTQVTKIVRSVQEAAMGMRMVPIRATFQKMKRLVRDVARKANKKVELHISGAETELDKTMVQQISDPLVHMVRNAVDHGIEPPDARRQAGKPETGNVYLDAYHQGDSIVIKVGDDGCGLDRDKLIAAAVERGLIGREDQLNDQQAHALVMHSGFSTAEQVTDISGRGVGMDVVRRNLEQLRGSIEIQSERGRGTTFLIRLPLTLAIIDGMLVRVGQERLIIPTILIEQFVRPQARQITTVQQRGEMLQVRGELCPLIQLGELFGYSGRLDPSETLVVIAHCGRQKVGLVVDELIGQQRVVIKSLPEGFKQVKGVSGAAILGDGCVGLILEPTGLLQVHNTRPIASTVRPRPFVTPAADPERALDAAGESQEEEFSANVGAVGEMEVTPA